jgi:mRNA interferase RelE/StbE
MSATLWEIHYEDQVVKQDIPQLSDDIRHRIRTTIENKLMTDPLHFGKPLRYSLSGQRSLRIGDYRVLYYIDHEQHRVLVTAIGHRRDIYEG